MAALLDRIFLRRDEPAVSRLTAYGDHAARPESDSASGIDGRPRLAAIWRAQIDGRLICTWSAFALAPDIPRE